jgi:hypothetical protein
MKIEEELKLLLEKKRKTDLEIADYFKREYADKIRFSSKKFVGDLGEFYFYKLASCFADLKQSGTSNSSCDFEGVLKPEYEAEFDLNKEKVKIEVKTRHAQKGDNHLFGVYPAKFDLLAFVALADDFQCRHIGIIKSSDIQTDKQNRIKYLKYYNEGSVLWKTNPWIEL